jgi:hypothetical protein
MSKIAIECRIRPMCEKRRLGHKLPNIRPEPMPMTRFFCAIIRSRQALVAACRRRPAFSPE